MASITTLVDRVKIVVLSSGSGPFELGPAVAGYRGAEALIDGASYNYATGYGATYEVGIGTYVASLGVLVRSPSLSTSGNAAVAFPANIVLSFTIVAADITPAGSLPIVQTTGSNTDVAMSQDATTTALADKLDGGGVTTITDITGILSILNGATVQASEAIVAGNFVNVCNTAGNLRVRKARANDPLTFANAFAPAAISSGASGRCIFGGWNLNITVAAPAAEVWLSDAAGGAFVTTPPTASGSIIQPLGVAIAGVGINFTPRERVLL